MADDQAARLHRLMDEHGERHERFQSNYRKKIDKLLACLLPDVQASSLERLSQAGFGFAHEMLQGIEEDRKRCEAELATLEEQLPDDNGTLTGGIVADLEKLEGHFEALQPFLKKCFGHPRFDELLLEGYGTDEYSKRIWHLSYYLDRRAAKEIEELCDGRAFAAIRSEAINALEASNVLKERIKSLTERKQMLAAAARQKKQLQDRLESHQQIWLASARRKLRDLIEADPPAGLEKCRTLYLDESLDWRLAGELCKEHWNLEVRFLKPAREAQEKGLKATCQTILDEYETLSDAMKRFDRPAAPKEMFDWKTFIFKNPEGG